MLTAQTSLCLTHSSPHCRPGSRSPADSGQLITRQRIGHSRVDHVQAQEVRVVSDKPVEIELDGDTLGTVSAMRVVVDPGSLLVRLPR